MKLKALVGAVLVAALGWYGMSSTARAQVVGTGNEGRAPQSVAEFEELFDIVASGRATMTGDMQLTDHMISR